MNETKILTQVVALGDQMEIVADEIIKLDLLMKLSRMKIEMIEATANLRLESICLRLEKLERA